MIYINPEDIPELTEEQINDILFKYKNNTEDFILCGLVLFYLPFLLLTAKNLIDKSKFNHCTLSHLDLVIAGTEGLKRAAKKFDSKRGVKFLTFASYDIKDQMSKEIFKHAYPIKINEYTYRNNKTKLEFEETNPDNSNNLKAIVTDNPFTISERKDNKQYRRAELSKGLKLLTKKKRQILLDRFFNGKSCEDIGKKYGDTKQGISSNTKHSLSKLKNILTEKGEFYDKQTE